MIALIGILFVASLHGALASTLEEHNDALWQQFKAGPELGIDEEHTLVEQIVQGLTEEQRRQARDDKSLANKPNWQDPRLICQRLQYAKYMLEIAEYSNTKCSFYAFLKLQATTEVVTGACVKHYTRHHYLGQVKFCESILAEKLAKSIEYMAIGQQLQDLKAKILASDNIADALANYLNPIATNDKDLVRVDSFKKLYSVQVVDLCQKVTEIEVLDRYRVIADTLDGGEMQDVKDWARVFRRCRDIVEDAQVPRMQISMKQTHERLLKMRSLTLKRTFAEKVFGCGLKNQKE